MVKKREKRKEKIGHPTVHARVVVTERILHSQRITSGLCSMCLQLTSLCQEVEIWVLNKMARR